MSPTVHSFSRQAVIYFLPDVLFLLRAPLSAGQNKGIDEQQVRVRS